VKLIPFVKRLFPLCPSDTLQFIELLFRISPRFCVVDKLIHQSPLPMCTWKIVGACGTERRGSREDCPNLTGKEGLLSERASKKDGREIQNAHCEVFWQAFYALALTVVFPVKSFGV
jgi:hypothetical protein